MLSWECKDRTYSSILKHVLIVAVYCTADYSCVEASAATIDTSECSYTTATIVHHCVIMHAQGKTETTKKMLHYISSVARGHEAVAVAGGSGSGTSSRPQSIRSNAGEISAGGLSLGERMVDSNALTEAFGNAKTVSNGSSVTAAVCAWLMSSVHELEARMAVSNCAVLSNCAVATVQITCIEQLQRV
jgi:Myosin head (motor domain)